MGEVSTGLDRFRVKHWKELKGRRVGLLSNQASLDSNLTHAKEVISCLLPGQLKVLFGPQHGHGCEDQDNMVETNHSFDRELKIPIFSLYSKNRMPSTEMFDPLDVLIIDLQDVGTRVYTFASTMLNCLKAAKIAGKKVLILDRPNPLGGEIIEGNLLKPELYSFVGPFSLPMRHGLTMGELACLFDQVFKIESELEIIPMDGWSRKMLWYETGIRWIMPSPNMPHPETAYVYPGQVIWEGTNLSEGRGTCRPFEIFGAPFLDTKMIRQTLRDDAMEGCCLQEITFRPTFHKWEGKLCRGFMIHVLDHRAFRPYFESIALLKAIIDTHGEHFQWKDPPYEYEYEKMPIDMILGSSELRNEIESGEDLFRIKERWVSDNEDFLEWRRPYLLY
ncbi:DUF1343 domain-containing protein [Deltaproteobacteria bacterium]|nr:DUF1343 domain-containing protein [Deltaproteobacteria bacterium]